MCCLCTRNLNIVITFDGNGVSKAPFNFRTHTAVGRMDLENPPCGVDSVSVTSTGSREYQGEESKVRSSSPPVCMTLGVPSNRSTNLLSLL
jgi:hypothetical protein